LLQPLSTTQHSHAIVHSQLPPLSFSISLLLFFNDTATTKIYTLSLHDALPISACNWVRSSLISVVPFDDFCTTRDGLFPLFVVGDRKSTRLNSSHVAISYAVFCLKKKKKKDGHHVIIVFCEGVPTVQQCTVHLD